MRIALFIEHAPTRVFLADNLLADGFEIVEGDAELTITDGVNALILHSRPRRRMIVATPFSYPELRRRIVAFLDDAELVR